MDQKAAMKADHATKRCKQCHLLKRKAAFCATTGEPDPLGFFCIDCHILQAKAEEATALASERKAQPPNGKTEVMLDDSYAPYVVMTRNADGSVSLHEVTGAELAKAAVEASKKQAQKSAPAPKGGVGLEKK